MVSIRWYVGFLKGQLGGAGCYFTYNHKNPAGPSTQYLRTLVPKAFKGMAFGTRVLRWGLGPSGEVNL